MKMRNLRYIHWLLVALLFLAIPAGASAQIAVGISVRIGPPALPVYEQPLCPGAGYIWTPGYWAYDAADGYYWVPGTWVLAPGVGMLWTPGYWGWAGGLYVWHGGYWGPHIGFYGGINYGFGYFGTGFVGGEWRGGVFAYNSAVSHVDVNVIHNTYVNKTVIVNNNVSRTSFNGGTGGTTATATAEERTAENEHHIAPTSAQTQQEHLASQNKAQFASNNHGNPGVAATAHSGSFSGAGVVAAHGATRTPANNMSDRPPSSRPANGTNGTNANGAHNTGSTPPGNNKPPTNTDDKFKPPTNTDNKGGGTPPSNNKPPTNTGDKTNPNANKGGKTPPPPKNNKTNNKNNNPKNGKGGKDGGKPVT
jgi:hypothetical protein